VYRLRYAPSGAIPVIIPSCPQLIDKLEAEAPAGEIAGGSRPFVPTALLFDVVKYVSGLGSFLPANRSIDLEYRDRASIRLGNAAAAHEPAVNSERYILTVDIQPPQPQQAYAAVPVADAVEAEAEVEFGAALQVGAKAETWAQAELGRDDEVEPRSRTGQGNISPASLKSPPEEPGLSSQAI
jgi:hypothetical protein